MTPGLYAIADQYAEAGELRRLSGAFARFVATSGKVPPALELACLLLSELEGRGHSCLQLEELANDPAALLGWDSAQWKTLAASCAPLPRTAAAWAEMLGRCEAVWQPGGLDFGEPLVLDGARLYLRRYWRDEATVASAVRLRASLENKVDSDEVRRWLDILFAGARAADKPDWQKVACAVAVRGSLAVITGGPGTGKTYTVARLLALLFALAEDPGSRRIALAAPTGKAAARLKQSIDKALNELADKVGGALPLRELTMRMGAARTLHSLLGARPDTRAFAHHAGNPLDVDVLIVDEASMVHLEMMAALLDALPASAMLVLLGDKDQLASVEAGAVLGDLCHDAEAGNYSQATVDYVLAASGEQVPGNFPSSGPARPLAQQTVMLRHSRRFGGPIGQLAVAVNRGDAAAAQDVLRSGADGLRWIEHPTQHAVVGLAVEGYAPYLRLLEQGPGSAAHEDWVRSILQAFEGFRILCAMRVGEWGVDGLNEAIALALGGAGLLNRRGEWYAGRPVMMTRNDYATGVYNGDIGIALADPARPASLRVYFLEGDAVRSVLATRLRHVETAFAMTVHKSQGSEFAHTVLVLPRERNALVTRELVYTGITRASRQFTLAAPTEVLAGGTAERTRRASGLREKWS
jgi:exodeoxyribonuclease V alpha subunit